MVQGICFWLRPMVRGAWLWVTGAWGCVARKFTLAGYGDGDHAPGGMAGGEGTSVVPANEMEDDPPVGRIGVVAVFVPAAGAQVHFDISSQGVAG